MGLILETGHTTTIRETAGDAITSLANVGVEGYGALKLRYHELHKDPEAVRMAAAAVIAVSLAGTIQAAIKLHQVASGWHPLESLQIPIMGSTMNMGMEDVALEPLPAAQD